jgi:predicted nicotinamide N-methyase
MWPSAVALSRWLVSNPDEVRNKDVLELGAGCGLVGLVAARINSKESSGDEIQQEKGSFTLTDFNDVVVKNIQQNIALNGLGDIAQGAGLDFYEQNVDLDGWKDTNGVQHKQVDLVLAADIICQKEDAFAAARSMFCALRDGGKAIVVSADSKHRFGVECFQEACRQLGLRVSNTGVNGLYGGNLISMNMRKTTGYVEGMSLTLYTVEKNAPPTLRSGDKEEIKEATNNKLVMQ